MSDSDSEQQQHFNLRKLPEEEQPHIKEILQKGKKILPSYDDEALYGLFKRYYCVENIFLNELHMIARRAKGDHDTDDRKKDEKWIKVGRQVKTKVNKTKYNFLEDKQLLRRAEQYLKNKKLVPERRENFTERKIYDRRPQTSKRQNNEQPHGTYNNRSAQNERPKQKFVQKVDDVKKEAQPVVQQQKTAQQKKKESPVKEQKYKEKVQTTTKVESKVQHKPVQQQPKQHELKKTQTQNHPPKHEEKKHHPSHHETHKQQAHKKQDNTKQAHHPVKTTHHEQKKTHESHHQKPQPEKKKVVAHQEKKQEVQPATHSIPTVSDFDSVTANLNFKQSCNQNSFILKFIQPQPYPQRISYIRTADGGMKNVQIRVTGTSNQGSQKNL